MTLPQNIRARIMLASGALIVLSAAMIAAAPARAALPGGQQAAPPAAQSTAPAPGATVRPVGTVKAIAGAAITLSTDAGAEVTIQIQDTTHILRIAPGVKDLKSATPAQLQDIEVGDRLLVGGKLGGDGKTVMATTAVVMKHADVAQTQEQEREDWQQHGIGGLVSSVDAAQGSVVITQTTVAGVKKTITIQASSSTIIRRYAPQSVKFEDAVTSTLDQIKPGDQVRARGTMGADGTSFSAEEIVSGEFRNISGTITSIDATASTITVRDTATKSQILVNISADSQVRRLAPFMAMAIASRLKGAQSGGAAAGAAAGGAPGGAPGGSAANANSNTNPGAPQTGGAQAGGGAGSAGGAAGGSRPGGGFGGARGGADLQQMLTRLPASTLADFQKGDAVMIVSTEGTASAGVTAITLLGGVEAILDASPNRASDVLLSPWTLSGPSGAEGGE
jgi:hypothetical protein